MIYKVYEYAGKRHVVSEEDYKTFLCGLHRAGNIVNEALSDPAYIANATAGLCPRCRAELENHARGVSR